MSKSINKVILIGHVGGDPEIKVTYNEQKVANFNLATNRQWKDKHGKDHDEVDWHRCVAWDGLVEVIEEWVKKGDQLYIEGRIKYDKAETDGEVKYYTSIVVSQMVMLGGGGPRIKSKRGKGSQFVPRELGDRNEEDLPF